MMESIPLKPVDGVTITSLIDNSVDLLMGDMGPATRAPLAGPRVPRLKTAFLVGGEGYDGLQAEHGFSALLNIKKGDKSHTVLFDAGLTPDGLIENMRRMFLTPKDIEAIVLSHSHWDHTTGMDGIVKALGKVNLPVLIHPEFWTKRRLEIGRAHV